MTWGRRSNQPEVRLVLRLSRYAMQSETLSRIRRFPERNLRTESRGQERVKKLMKLILEVRPGV